MRCLLIADAGDGLLDLALRSLDAGHEVRWFCRRYDPHTRPIGKGLVDRVPDWHPSMQWADLVVLEANGFAMREFGTWRARGVPIIGGDDKSAAWELDRNTGMRVFEEAGIAVPPYREFTDYDQAIRYVERRGEPLYSKPCSDTADKSLSAKTGIPEDPTFMLRKWKKKHGRPPCPFLLQDGIDGVEFAVGAWFGPGGFAQGFEENFEHKRLCSGDLGQNTGEMGTVSRIVQRSKLAQKVLVQLEEPLNRIGYVGNVDVNCIVDEGGNPWPLEFTMRLGWPAFNLETDLFDCDPIEFLHALASGETIRGGRQFDEVATGVVLAIPPYPHPPRDYDDILGVPIFGTPAEGWHPCEVQAGAEGADYATAGDYVGIQVGTGDRVSTAAREAYRGLKRISMPSSPFWRNDIGLKLRRQLDQLQAHGFASGMEY
jgi:phosphoribosylamine--glycine ligase